MLCVCVCCPVVAPFHLLTFAVVFSVCVRMFFCLWAFVFDLLLLPLFLLLCLLFCFDVFASVVVALVSSSSSSSLPKGVFCDALCLFVCLAMPLFLHVPGVRY